MDNSKKLKDDVKTEAARKDQESVAANSLPANLNQPVEQGLAKASSDEAGASPYSKPRLPAIKAAKPASEGASDAAKAEYLAPSEPLDKEPPIDSSSVKRAAVYVSPSCPLTEAPDKKPAK